MAWLRRTLMGIEPVAAILLEVMLVASVPKLAGACSADRDGGGP